MKREGKDRKGREEKTWKGESEQMVCRDRKPFAYTFSTVFLTLTMLDLPTLINFALPISEQALIWCQNQRQLER